METILFERRGHIGLVTLNRPERKNAYSLEMSAELSQVMVQCDHEDDIRCIVVTAAGDNFSVGYDLNDLRGKLGDDNEAPTFGERTYPCDIRKPVICAINGRAGGWGIAYPLTCDIRVIAEDAILAFSFVRNGLVPEMGASWILPRLVGPEKALELLLVGGKITGLEAEKIGLVSKALPAGQVMDYAMEMAMSIASMGAPGCVAYTKRLVWNRLTDNDGLHNAIVQDRDHFLWSTRQADCNEGAAAFLQKREPIWTGSASKDLPVEILSQLS